MPGPPPIPPGPATTALIVARHTVQEAARGRALRGLALIGVLLLALFAFAADRSMAAARRDAGSITVDVVGATLLGSAAFTALLLGAVVAVILTSSALRGDVERGVLQPLAARPVSRTALVLGRTTAGAAIAAACTLALWLGAVAVVRLAGDWGPPRIVDPALALALAVALVALGTTATSAFVTATATAILVLALVGAGLSVGLLAQLGSAFGLGELRTVADVVATGLPFEALYRHVLSALAGEHGDLAGAGVSIGPFGGARALAWWHAPAIALWSTAAVAVVVARSRSLPL